MKTYNCGFCKKEFKQKIDYLRHRDRKTPCINMATLNMLSMQKIKNDSDMKTLRTFYSKCFNILRDNELLTGDKALRNLSYLLILKLMESKLEEINFRGYDDYIFDIEDDEEIEELFNLTRFSYLGKSKELNIRSQLNAVWDQILSQHPKTKEIFIRKKGFDIKYTRTYTKLIEEISKINFSIIDQDVQGEAYEDILKDTLKGKILGQFFTPPIIKKLCVDLVKPKITQDGKTETIFDLAMGPGGFLLTAVKYLEKEATYKNIKLDWDFISNEGLGGIEAEPDTFQLAKSNMLISTGKLCDNIHLGNSIRNTIEGKYDIVLTNPPFGIKGLHYFDIENEKRDIYLPIKSNSAVPLFIQAIIYILKVNGRCAVVLPNGQELDSSNQDLVAAREYLMKTCDLKEVICLPAGIFTHTSIRTCIFYFVKKKECSSILKTEITCSKKTGKETKRTYEFSKSHSTKSVKFYECNPHTDFKELKADVPIEQVAGNSYSLNYNDYLEDNDEKYEDTEEIKWMKLGDVCELIKGKHSSNKTKTLSSYPYRFITKKRKNIEYCNFFDIENENIFIYRAFNGNGYFGISFYDGKCAFSNLIYLVKLKNTINTRFFYYWLLTKRLHIQNNMGKGVANKVLDKKLFNKIKIPIPSLEKQQEIVEQLDFLNEECNTTATERIAQLKRKNKIFLETQIRYGDNMIEKLGDICDFLPKSKRKASYGKKEGQYPFFKSSMNVNTYVDEPDYKEESIIIGTGGNPNIKYCKEFSCSTDNFILKINNINTKFIYYYLFNNIHILEKGFKGSTIKHISKQFTKNIKIPIPPLEKQQEIVSFCESNDRKIKELEEEIEFNKKLSSQILSSIFKSSETKKESDEESDNESDNKSDNEDVEEDFEEDVEEDVEESKNYSDE